MPKPERPGGVEIAAMVSSSVGTVGYTQGIEMSLDAARTSACATGFATGFMDGARRRVAAGPIYDRAARLVLHRVLRDDRGRVPEGRAAADGSVPAAAYRSEAPPLGGTGRTRCSRCEFRSHSADSNE